MADTWLLGGTGTMNNASNFNGGGFVTGGTATYATSQGDNGGPTSLDTWDDFQTACTVTDAGGSYLYINKTDGPGTGFWNCAIGSYVYINFAATYVDDWYEVEDVLTDKIMITTAWSANTTCDCNVGGALDNTGTGIDTALDLVAADDLVYACTDTTTSTEYLVGATINPPGTAGAALTPIIIKGVNKDDGTDLSLTDARPIFKASATLANGIIMPLITTTDYYRWENLIFDGDNQAAYCVCSTVTADWHYFYYCDFKNATANNVHVTGSYWTFVNCDSCGANIGVRVSGSYCLVVNSFLNDNSAHGMNISGIRNIGINCTSYNNGERGIALGNGNHGGALINCTEYDAGQHGYHFGTGTSFLTILNNTASGNNVATYKDYNFDGITTPIACFSNNHANSNTYCSEVVNANFADFMNGNNISGDPKFVSVVSGSEDFDLLFDSPLQRNGIKDTTIGAGTRLETTEGRQDVAFAAIYIQEEDVS